MKITLLLLLISLKTAAQSDSLYGWKRTPEGYIQPKLDTLRGSALVGRNGYQVIQVDGYIVFSDMIPVKVIKARKRKNREQLIPMKSWTTIWGYTLAEDEEFHYYPTPNKDSL